MMRSSWSKEGLVSIGGAAQPRRWQMVLSDSSKDDRSAVPPPPSTEMPPSAMLAGAKT